MRITKRNVDALPRPAKRTHYYDDDLKGFGVIVYPSGRKTYVVEYRPGPGGRATEKKRHTIGRHGSPWTADEARKEARRLLAAVENGADPAAERAAKRKAPAAEETVEAVAERFLERHVSTLRASTARDYRDIVKKRLIPRWGGRHIADIGRKDVIDLIDEIAVGAPVMARLVFSVVRKLFNWTIEKDLRDESPCAKITPPKPPKSRERVLADDEIVFLWKATEALSPPRRAASRVMLLTGAREAEVAGMTWDEIDLDGKVWRLPSSRSKNDSGHEIDLSDLVIEQIRALDDDTVRALRAQKEPERSASSISKQDRINYGRQTLGPYVFGARCDKPLGNWWDMRREVEREIARLRRDGAKPEAASSELTAEEFERFRLPAWCWHDLRRTAATNMAGLGFGAEVVERVLNHQSGVRGGLVGVYQRHEYRPQRKAAVEVWAARVADLVSGTDATSNVVPIDQRAAS
jgi:integrase